MESIQGLLILGEIQVCYWFDDSSWVKRAGATCVWKLALQKKNNAQIADIDIDPSIRGACAFTISFYRLFILFGVFIHII